MKVEVPVSDRRQANRPPAARLCTGDDGTSMLPQTAKEGRSAMTTACR